MMRVLHKIGIDGGSARCKSSTAGNRIAPSWLTFSKQTTRKLWKQVSLVSSESIIHFPCHPKLHTVKSRTCINVCHGHRVHGFGFDSYRHSCCSCYNLGFSSFYLHYDPGYLCVLLFCGVGNGIAKKWILTGSCGALGIETGREISAYMYQSFSRVCHSSEEVIDVWAREGGGNWLREGHEGRYSHHVLREAATERICDGEEQSKRL